jgi:predicted nucleic acid-binding Zn ribbon protein
MERLCIDCGNPLHGRVDKKFCDDQCRSNYNNKTRTESNGTVKTINTILKRNRDILERFNPDGKSKVSAAKLMAAGFNLDYHTHIYHTQKGSAYIFCYEYGYLKLAANEFLLVKKEIK